jgi:ribonucleoside-diphosphate reductase alpha chain
MVIKRDGREEPFSWDKLKNVLLWAAKYKTNIGDQLAEFYVDSILKNMNLRIHDKIRIEKLFDELIDVAANMASRMYPEYDLIARNLFIQKIYKETWSIKRDEYPDYKDVVKKGLQYGVYDEKIWNSFTEDEIETLGTFIEPENDFVIGSYLGITVFFSKYCKKYTKTKHLELPQHAIMRYAVNAFWNEPRAQRLQLIKELYEYHIEKLAESVSSPTKWVLAEAKMLGEIGKIKPYPEYPPMVETLIEYIANSDNNLDPLEVEMQNKIMKAIR